MNTQLIELENDAVALAPEIINRYFIINKPYKMVSQFISSHRVGLLGDLDFEFPEHTHAIGRLDNHSEGLLILTTNKKITKLLFESKVPHQRTYLVLVKHQVQEPAMEQLRNGVSIRVKGGGDYITRPCEAEIITDPNAYFNDTHPLKLYPPYTWLLLKLTEGKFHQVRKMVDAVGHQCKRLIRVAIEDLHIGDLPKGGVREVEEAEFFSKLKL